MLATTRRFEYPESELSAQEVDRLREQLQAERARLLVQLQHDLQEGRQTVDAEPDDSLGHANASYDREKWFALSESERDTLRQIDEALERIETGTYGICEHSGLPIPTARLEAIPWARYRTEYAELAELGLLEESS